MLTQRQNFQFNFYFCAKKSSSPEDIFNGHIAGSRRQMQKFERHLVTFYVLNSTLEVK